MIYKLDETALVSASNRAFRTAVIRKVNQLVNAVNTGVVWDNKVDADRKNEATNIRVDKVDITQSIAFVTLAEAGQIDEVTAGEHIEQFEVWTYPIDYKVGQLRQYEGLLYKCVLDHTSQEDWTPQLAVSLWTATSGPVEEWPLWSQPIGAHDAYGLGDKVTHNGKKWTSDVDNNVWEPGVYGWNEYVEETTEETNEV